MATEVKLPRLGQGMESGTIVKWLKGEGDPVKKREPLYELDTDKVTQEVEAEADGVLLKIVVDSGEVEVGRTIAFIGSEGEDVPSGNGAAPSGAAATETEPTTRPRPRRTRRRRARRRRRWTRSASAARRPPPRPQRPRLPPRRRQGRRPRQGVSARTAARAREGDRHRAGRRLGAGGPDHRAGRRAGRPGAAGGGTGRRPPRGGRGRGAGAHLDAQDDRAPPDGGLAGARLPAHGLRRHDADAGAARAARRPARGGRDEADRVRPADEGGRGRARPPHAPSTRTSPARRSAASRMRMSASPLRRRTA